MRSSSGRMAAVALGLDEILDEGTPALVEAVAARYAVALDEILAEQARAGVDLPAGFAERLARATRARVRLFDALTVRLTFKRILYKAYAEGYRRGREPPP